MNRCIILLFLILLFSCGRERETFIINGEIKNIPDGTVIDLYEYHDDYGKLIDSATVVNGCFEFTGTGRTLPTEMDLSFRDRKNFYGNCRLWIKNEVINITGNNKFPTSWKVKSSNKEQIALEDFKNQTKELSIFSDSLRLLRIQNKENAEFSEQLKKSIDSIGKIRREIEFSFVENNPNSLNSVEFLYRIAKIPETDRNRVELIYEKLDDFYKNSLFGQGIQAAFDNKPIPEIGDEMINFVAYDTAGVKHSLSDFKGKFILLDFWHLGCSPCNASIHETSELYKNNNETLTIVGINLISDERLWLQKTRDEGINWVNLSDGKGTYSGVSSIYGIAALPTYFLINPEGMIIEKWLGYKEGIFKEKLSKHIENLKF